MLIRFRVKNFLSFKGEAELSLVPSRVTSHKHHVVRDEASRTDIPVLRSAFVFGANASGKSNLIKAIGSAQSFIRRGVGSGRSYRPEKFGLDKRCAVEPTEFVFEIKAGGSAYEFGFAVHSGEVVKEWLYIISKKTAKPVYFRERINGISRFENGKLKLPKQEEQFFVFTQKGTPEGKLFLTECDDRNLAKNVPSLDSVKNVFKWFDETLTVIFPHSSYAGLEINLKKDVEFGKPFLAILKKFDTGINALDLKSMELDDGLPDIPNDILEDVLEKIDPDNHLVLSASDDTRYLFSADEEGKIKASKIVTGHRGIEGQQFEFDLSDESDGTRRLLDLIPGLLSILMSKKVLIIDELDRSLHPDITHSVVSSFLNNGESQNSQLVVTTHDRGLLRNSLIRKDEIWFAQKNRDGESSLYSLEEFKGVRKDTDVRKGYQLGRFGGVPVLSEITPDDIFD